MNPAIARAALVTALALGPLTGCVTPAPNHGAYLENARGALESAISETTTAGLAVQARLDGRSTNAYADVVVTESEQALAPIEASFGGVDPPSRADDTLRDSTLERLGAAADALAAARLAVRRDDPAALVEAAAGLGDVTDELEQALQELG